MNHTSFKVNSTNFHNLRGFTDLEIENGIKGIGTY